MWQQTKNIYHLGMAILANLRFNFPSKKLVVIGVTGTDGKTTTVALVYHILKEAGLNLIRQPKAPLHCTAILIDVPHDKPIWKQFLIQ